MTLKLVTYRWICLFNWKCNKNNNFFERLEFFSNFLQNYAGNINGNMNFIEINKSQSKEHTRFIMITIKKKVSISNIVVS